MAKTTSLPVLMYHYISRHPDSIAVSPDLFAAHCEILAKHGWRGVSLREAESYFLRGEDLPAKSCCITFDDGYLDNYVHAWPILQKYGHHGTVFAVSDRIGAEDLLRPTIADVWTGKITAEHLPRVDQPFIVHANGYDVREDLFMTWREARAMEQSGVMAVASHTLAHQGIFINELYDGFFLPERVGRTFRKPSPFFWGLPKFTMGPGLCERAFLIDPELADAIMRLVPQEETEAFRFASDERGVKTLKSLVSGWKTLGRMETDDEMEERTRTELEGGKRVLEEGLGHDVASLCWPWGAYSAFSLDIARQAGFQVMFTTAMGANPPKHPLTVRRFKAKAKSASWLLGRVRLHSRPLLAALYAACQIPSSVMKGKRKSFVIRRQQ